MHEAYQKGVLKIQESKKWREREEMHNIYYEILKKDKTYLNIIESIMLGWFFDLVFEVRLKTIDLFFKIDEITVNNFVYMKYYDDFLAKILNHSNYLVRVSGPFFIKVIFLALKKLESL